MRLKYAASSKANYETAEKAPGTEVPTLATNVSSLLVIIGDSIRRNLNQNREIGAG
jgi:hypothetical protein